jgi:hypothetical protein
LRLFGLETKYFALKLGAAAVSLLTLPGVYLLGRDLFGRWVGLWATFFTAVASWPVATARVGLRFPFAPAATAWALFFLLRGLRKPRERDSFVLLGLWLGIGLHGYTAFRAMPLAVVICWGLYWLFCRRDPQFVWNALTAVLIALVVFIPLGRFALEHPENFWLRSLNRMADPAVSVSDHPLVILGQNLWDLALMFNWQGDNVWVNTVMGEPVLDPVLGGLFVLGLVIVLWRGLRLNDNLSVLLLIAGAVLLLPSALSLAYPIENPSVVRTGGAIPVVMTVAALPVGWGLAWGFSKWGMWRRGLLVASALLLSLAVIKVNYERYFETYREQYVQFALNTSEIAAVIQEFVQEGGDPANAWIIAWPHWIDTRGAGIELGDPTWNNVILDLADLDAHQERPRPRLYLFYPPDDQALQRLRTLFPSGRVQTHISEQQPRWSFISFYVPVD